MHDQSMEHHFDAVAILTIGFGLASLFGFIAQYFRLPTILGYLLAGFIIGPYSPGFVADLTLAEQLAEIGIILMLFGVGMHFKLEDLINVKNIAIPGAIVQTLMATLVAIVVVHYFSGWPLESGLIIGLSIGVASTVVLVRILTDFHLLNTIQGHIAVGWLVVEDIFTVLILIILPTIAAYSMGDSFSFGSAFGAIGIALVKFLLLTLFMFTLGQWLVGKILTNVARLRSQELFTLTVIASVFVIAAGAYFVFGTSIPLGAFIAGMVIGKTSVKHQAAANALPLKDIFAIIFFLSVGMLFNPEGIYVNFKLFLGIIGIILVVKPLSAYFISIVLGYPIKVALTVALALAQIGEFSFILSEQAMNFKLIPEEAFDIIVACALISISLNPFLFRGIDFLEKRLNKFKYLRSYERRSAKVILEDKIFSPKVVVVGFGPIGREVCEILKEAGYMPMIIEQNIDTVSEQEKEDYIIFGDAAEPSLLNEAQIEEASHLIITIPDTAKTVDIIQIARHANPKIKIISRSRFINEKLEMDKLKVDFVCTESEALKAFTALVREILYSKYRLIH